MKVNPTRRPRLRPETLDIIKERKRKILRKKIRADYQEFNEKKAIEAALNLKLIKKVRKATSLYRDATAGLKDDTGTVQYSAKEKT